MLDIYNDKGLHVLQHIIDYEAPANKIANDLSELKALFDAKYELVSVYRSGDLEGYVMQRRRDGGDIAPDDLFK